MAALKKRPQPREVFACEPEEESIHDNISLNEISLGIGYVKRSEAETSVLFELIAHRYEIKSLLITSNQTFSEWDAIFADATMTVAAIDRLIHHATIIEIQTQSFRQKTALSRSTSADSKRSE